MPRAESTAYPTPNESPIATIPKRIPMTRLATTFAATTRVRCGVTTKVGRIVPCRISLVIAITPIKAAKRAPLVPAESSVCWLSWLCSSVALRANPLISTVRSVRAIIPARSPRFVRVERILRSSESSWSVIGAPLRSARGTRPRARGLRHQRMEEDVGVVGDLPHASARRALDAELVAVEERRADAFALEGIPQARCLRRADSNVAGESRRQIGERRERHELALVDDHDLIDRLRDLGEHVTRDEDRLARRRELTEKVAQPTDTLRVEPVRGLVEDQDLRIAEQRAREPEPLPHPERIAANAAAAGAA